MRQIADAADLSMGNVYYHFPSKEALFERLLEEFSKRVFEADAPFRRIFEIRSFPEDLEILAQACEELVSENIPYFKLIYVDVVEFQGEHIRNFYLDTAKRYRERFATEDDETLEGAADEGVDPAFAATFTTRWLVYYFIVEKCFGVPEHMGIPTQESLEQFFHLLRRGMA